MHMQDPIPIMAFGIDGGPPVIYLNHGDHVFWLGPSISDIVCDVRPAAQRLTLKRRNVQTSRLLPIPLSCPQLLPDKNFIRKELGLPEDTNIILSMASDYKYNSFSEYDFTDFLKSILQRNRNSKILIVGPRNSGKWFSVFKDTNGGIMAVGPQSGIEKYYSCADIYLDSYMFCSMTSALDAGLRGVPLAYMKNHKNELLSCDDISLEGLNNGFNAIDDYLEYIDRLLKDKEFAGREGNALSDSIKAHHVYLWEDYLNKAYKLAENTPHTINLREFKDEIGKEDLFLALFQNQCP
jgi:Predicted O-linked N-acetylglucosamine transferase, SPINDLY family